MNNLLPRYLLLATVISTGLCSSIGHTWLRTTTPSGEPISWESSCFYYSIHEDGSPDIPLSELSDIIDSSFATWEDVECSYLYFEPTSFSSADKAEFRQDGGNVNLLVWRNDASSWPTNNRTIALTSVNFDPYTGVIYDADIEFNNVDYSFSSDLTQPSAEENPFFVDTVDLQSTVTHEIGHMLGLAHSDMRNATMYAWYADIETDNSIKQTLHADDIAGLCDIYPVQTDPGVCHPPFCGLDLSGISNNCEKHNDNETQSCSCRATGQSSSTILNIWEILTILLK